MSDKDKRTRARRNLLLSIGGGIFLIKTLPEKWIKPVVDTVVLPAHAGADGSGDPKEPG
jgi:hypothetical protein